MRNTHRLFASLEITYFETVRFSWCDGTKDGDGHTNYGRYHDFKIFFVVIADDCSIFRRLLTREYPSENAHATSRFCDVVLSMIEWSCCTVVAEQVYGATGSNIFVKRHLIYTIISIWIIVLNRCNRLFWIKPFLDVAGRLSFGMAATSHHCSPRSVTVCRGCVLQYSCVCAWLLHTWPGDAYSVLRRRNAIMKSAHAPSHVFDHGRWTIILIHSLRNPNSGLHWNRLEFCTSAPTITPTQRYK